jgi:hypothetical protein
MNPRHGRILVDLERYRSECCDGTLTAGEVLRRLAELRLGLLRAHRRAVALVLSEGAAGGARLPAAVDAALAMLRSEAEAPPAGAAGQP